MKREFSLDRYRFYVAGNKVVAVSSYAGQTVRGVAICSDADAFDLQKGKELAAARCSVKIARKRYDWARAKELSCWCALQLAENRHRDACAFCDDSEKLLRESLEKLELFEKTL